MTTMQIDRAVVEQALDALETGGWNMTTRAITALRAALAQQAEPVAWEGWWLHHGQHNYRAKPLSPERVKELMKLAFEVGREATLPQQAEPLNLSDPAVQKRLATQWGYVPAAQAEPVEPVATLIAQRNDILRMAREAGCIPRRHPEYDNDVQVFATPDVLERFAALVAAAERDACAALLEANGMRCGEESLSRLILETNAAAIRARNP